MTYEDETDETDTEEDEVIVPEEMDASGRMQRLALIKERAPMIARRAAVAAAEIAKLEQAAGDAERNGEWDAAAKAWTRVADAATGRRAAKAAGRAAAAGVRAKDKDGETPTESEAVTDVDASSPTESEAVADVDASLPIEPEPDAGEPKEANVTQEQGKKSMTPAQAAALAAGREKAKARAKERAQAKEAKEAKPKPPKKPPKVPKPKPPKKPPKVPKPKPPKLGHTPEEVGIGTVMSHGMRRGEWDGKTARCTVLKSGFKVTMIGPKGGETDLGIHPTLGAAARVTGQAANGMTFWHLAPYPKHAAKDGARNK